jgi:hypothetical protein
LWQSPAEANLIFWSVTQEQEMPMESSMNTHLKIIASQIAGPMQQIGAQFDPEVLQWLGGSVIALLLLFRSCRGHTPEPARGRPASRIRTQIRTDVQLFFRTDEQSRGAYYRAASEGLGEQFARTCR